MQKAGVPLETYADLPAETVYALYPEVLDAELAKTIVHENLPIYDIPHVKKLLTDYSLLFQTPNKKKHKWSKIRTIRVMIKEPSYSFTHKKEEAYDEQVRDFMWQLHNNVLTTTDSDKIFIVEADIILALKPFETYTVFSDAAIQMSYNRNSYNYLKVLLYILGLHEVETKSLRKYVDNLYPYTVKVCNTISEMASRPDTLL